MPTLLGVLRCEYCDAELAREGYSYNELYWEARRLGWYAPEQPTEGGALCGEHNKVEDGKIPEKLRWTVDCDICDWEDEFDNQKEAQNEALLHDCADYIDPRPVVTSPEERAEYREAVEAAAQRRREQERETTDHDERLHATFTQITTFYEEEIRKRKRHPWLFKLIDFLDRAADTR